MATVKGSDDYAIMPQITGIDIIPTGGSAGDVLTKDTATDYDYSWITPSGSTIIVQDEGITVGGGPHDTLNFVGAGVVVTDGTGGVATITISGGGSQNLFETFTPDSGGNIVADTATDTLTLAGGTGITTVGTPGTDTITFDTVDSEIVHDNLSGFVADEHVAHTGVILTAGTGLTGGGDISASRTFDVIGGEGITANANDIELDYTVATVTAVSGDFIQISDASAAGAVRKVDASDFLGGGGATDLAAVQARRTTAYTLTTAFVDITFDTTDEETDPAIVEHNNTNTDDIDIKEAGTYLIRYESDTVTTAATNNTNIQMEARIRINDTVVLPGSEAMCASFEDNSVGGSEGPQHLSNAFIVTLAASDKVTLQLSKVELAGSTVYTAERISFQVVKLEGANGVTGPTGPPGTSGSLLFYGDQLEDTDNADWAVNATALEVADPANAALIVRRFDDTIEEGVGFSIAPPAGTTSLKFTFVARAQTAPGAVRTVGLKLYNRGIPDNAAVESWNAGTILADIDIPTNAFFQYDTETITLSTLGMTVGEDTQLQLTRIDPVAGTELTGDWNLRALQVEFV